MDYSAVPWAKFNYSDVAQISLKTTEVKVSNNIYNKIIRDRIRTLISREAGTGPLVNHMRWRSLARKVYALQGGNPDTKKGKHDLKFLTVSYVVYLNITDEQWVDVFEYVVQQYAKQM